MKCLEVPRKLRSIKDLLLKYRDEKQLWEIDNKTTYKWLIDSTINKEKNSVEQKHINVQWEKAWGNWTKISSLKMKSILFKYMHDAWLTGEIAVRRHMIAVSPKCPLCKTSFYNKFHIIIQCRVTKNDRDNLITKIKQTQTYNRNRLLYLDGDYNKNLLQEITSFIVQSMMACGSFLNVRNGEGQGFR